MSVGNLHFFNAYLWENPLIFLVLIYSGNIPCNCLEVSATAPHQAHAQVPA
jgi:hypothetical protein